MTWRFWKKVGGPLGGGDLRDGVQAGQLGVPAHERKSWDELWKGAVTFGHGASSTKIVYVTVGRLGAYSALFLTVSFCVHALTYEKADAIFASAVGAIWVAVFGFATRAQNVKARTDQTVTTTMQESK